MIFEQFVWGIFDNTGYKLYASPEVSKILLPQSLEKLQNLSLKRNQYMNTVQLHFPTENVVTFTHLRVKPDTYGRASIVNHTIIVRVQDLISYAYRLIDKHLYNPVDEKPGELGSIIV